MTEKDLAEIAKTIELTPGQWHWVIHQWNWCQYDFNRFFEVVLNTSRNLRPGNPYERLVVELTKRRVLQ